MTLNNMVELVRQLHPNVGRTQVIFDLNTALVDFTQETRLLYSRVFLTAPTDVISYDPAIPQTAWQLPQEVFEVTYVDNIYNNEYFLDEDVLKVDWIDRNVRRLRVEYVRYPLAITADQDAPEIPDRFHEAIVARVIEKYFMREGKNLQAAQYWSGIYKENVRNGKRYANTKPHRNENPSVGGVKMITAFRTGLSLVQGVNTITMNRTFTTKNSYALVFKDIEVDVTEYSSDVNDPHADRTRNSFKVFATDAVVADWDFIATGN